MCDFENVVAVKAETLTPLSTQDLQQGVVLQPSPTGQTKEPAFFCVSVMDKEGIDKEEGDEAEGKTVAETCGEEPNQPPSESCLAAPDTVAVEASIQGETPSPTSVQVAENTARDLPAAEDELDPDYDPDVDPEGVHAFPCHHCQRCFMTRQGLERHLHIHTATPCHSHVFKCRYGSKVFGSQFSRRRHERRHNGEKKRLCSLSVASGKLGLTEADQRRGLGDSEERKGSHICKFCKKAFGTHTNLRRHQRRVHERHLLPKGICKKGLIQQQSQAEKLPPADSAQASPATSPPPCFANEETEREEEYMVDISSNISENLSFYIDGKIVSTSAVSNCEVVEVNSGSATIIGLDSLVISPAQISQALKLQTTPGAATGQPEVKRRTATPPLLPQIKTELESEPILTAASLPDSFSTSFSSSSTLVGTILPQPLDSLAFRKDKTVYLSPKLKQLLQSHDGSKPTFTLISDSHKLGSPLSLTVLPIGSNRFKRRTGPPPNSPQQNSSVSTDVSPQLERHCSSPPLGLTTKGDRGCLHTKALEPVHFTPLEWLETRTGGDSCNQQPLDLSSAVSKKENSEDLEEAVLDLSMHRKYTETDMETAGSTVSPGQLKKSKPNSSILQKVLRNEYVGVSAAGDEIANIPSIVTDVAIVTTTSTVPSTPEPLVVELPLPTTTFHSSPPSLTPVTIHPLSPYSPILCSPTPPPPILPFISSPLITVTSANPIPTSSSIQPSFSLLSPEMSISTAGVGIDQALLGENGAIPLLTDWANAASTCLGIPGITSETVLESRSQPLIEGQSVAEITQTVPCANSVIPIAQVQTFTPTVSVNESSIHSYSIIPNAVVIECTVSLESSETFVPVFTSNPVESPYGKMVLDGLEQGQSMPLFQTLEPVITAEQPVKSTALTLSPTEEVSVTEMSAPSHDSAPIKEESRNLEEPLGFSVASSTNHCENLVSTSEDKVVKDETSQVYPLCNSFVCNVCEKPFQSIKQLTHHISEHSEDWPFKCEFCVQLFESAKLFLEHRSSYHGIGNIYVCSLCSKEFAFLCNLQQHQKDLHPGQTCSYTEVEDGKLRPQNYNSPFVKDNNVALAVSTPQEGGRSSRKKAPKKEEEDNDDNYDHSTEELYTTIKIMASEVGKPKSPDVRLGKNQHYPSFKPPPFPYHNRSPGGSVASATNFTTHNIPQTFSTAIRCTKCGKSFDNMPELHKHILACANASDKKRYTPKKNPIPLKQFAKAQNGVLSPTLAVNVRHNVSRKTCQAKRLGFGPEPPSKLKLSALSKRKAQLVQKAVSQRSKVAMIKRSSAVVEDDQDVHVCPHCGREFTYRASLTKHVALGCPSKPMSKRSRKRRSRMPLTQENNGNIRRRSDALTKHGSDQGPRALGKTKNLNPGLTNNGSLSLKSHMSKVKSLSSQQFGMKRPALLATSTVHPSKKSKPLAKMNLHPQQGPPKLTILSPMSKCNSSQWEGMNMQCLVREVPPPQNFPETKTQPKRDERVSARVRERVGGPITRSLQQTGTGAALPDRGGGSDPKDTHLDLNTKK
ncbi:PR domain zinc finger protein 2 [Denticeps clupeoides]|uniref:C2H2-type domain-containing protein n=1 Tax=Denticeps clupeoides TaxID=299321 RepID=A0AAY4B9I6_9TELE|nr:PR domain zinc finger protein 2-like [Denticeps clupeoides]